MQAEGEDFMADHRELRRIGATLRRQQDILLCDLQAAKLRQKLRPR
jgi:hypothetical protein